MEKMEKMEKDKRKERNEGSKYQIRPTYSVLNLVALLQPKTRQVLSITNDRNMEQQLKRSSFVVTATKTLTTRLQKSYEVLQSKSKQSPEITLGAINS